MRTVMRHAANDTLCALVWSVAEREIAACHREQIGRLAELRARDIRLLDG